MESVSKLICDVCQKKFCSVSSKKQHLKKMHDRKVEEKMTLHIRCPLCPEEKQETLGNHDILINHLTEVHCISIKQSDLSFRSIPEFEAWRSKENREVDYACARRKRSSNGDQYIYYDCNRSDSCGFKSHCNKGAKKAGGSIKISGICPSRILVKIFQNGLVSVKYVETHVGHQDELRTKRLTKQEQTMIVDQLHAGVTNERILQDMRKIKDVQLERINLITRGDLGYLIRKFNIDKKRDADDMVATGLKIEEWNKEGKNHAFLFKKIGESHPDLCDEDFAVGYMNNIMEKKLRNFQRVICIDGTHGTNRRNFELTTVLIKDDGNMGFPVAFLLSNRLDQVIQKVFFRALRDRFGYNIEAKYVMSDDDPKYYNAWTEAMTTAEKPERLLCTWHVVKNWNIQGRSKLKKQENRLQMKKEMRKILNETKIEDFMVLKEKYLQHLKDEGELEFLRYLEKYYFQEDRIKMWAHCFRINAGVNTNMAIESLHKVLKYNKMKRNRNIRVEKLLDLLDELVDEKMWKNIVNTERPNANNYQHKITVKAHMKAEEMKDFVESMEFGTFKVKSSTGEKFYIISYNELCDDDCRRSYCNECKICIHRYICECPEFSVKTALCKHIHAVVLYERRMSESVPGVLNIGNLEEENSEETLYIQEPTSSKIRYQDELCQFLEEKNNEANKSIIDSERRQQILVEEIQCFTKSLDMESLDKFADVYRTFRNNLEREKKNEICKKRKIEKQMYYPNKN